ncbi:Gfo/Idh/MocA family oxidoreductase [Thiobacillus thioparus]|jgi:diaminopimelate dehydrogenase|uniref:Gfo/Idh/MocA family oxidoreductase n=1 Tax=Thiobacillus thioparus TaxID=931 RepID=UPI000381B6F5|nr:Gfo/Idh/MocA family oxidoreductase [Thiobacillus thioparus]
MKKIRLAIIGLGRLGRKCAEAIAADRTAELAGVVRRPERAEEAWLKAPSVTHVSELDYVDAALICVPVDAVMGVAQALLQSRIPVVECARLHGESFLGHKAEIHRDALRHKLPAIVGAGCDPGALSLFRSQFAQLAPRGHTETSLHIGTSLHHTLAAAGIKGVKQALATELQSPEGRRQRYVYVELEPSANATEVENALINDPLFCDEETRVFSVPSIAALEETNRGVVLERRAAAGEAGHASFLLEARYDEAGLAARMMLAAARALPSLQAGAYSLLDLPPGALWGEQRPAAEKEWM